MKATKLIAEASIYIDELRPKKDGKCSVKIKVTYNRKRKYFSTGIDLTAEEFEKIFYSRRKTNEQKLVEGKLLYFKTKAIDIINKLPVFTFNAFEEYFLDQRNTLNSVSFGFDNYIKQLKLENRLGTASSYECAKNSIDTYQKNLTFADITPTLLKNYENWMLSNGKSISTVGIYLRSLRAIYNQQNIDKNLYPFGEARNKYSIPTSRNIKKALSVEEIAKIYNYEAEPNSNKEMGRDYWLFLYLCNGMNVKDFCLLKWGNIENDMLHYKRSKTERSKKESKLISVALKPQTMVIINKWGQPSNSKDAYIFPHLKIGMTAEKQRITYQLLAQLINKNIKKICIELDIKKNVTTYFARHSFATVLKRSGANIGMISELLGHSSVDVTERYLDSFEKEQIQEQTDVLTEGFKKAN